MKDTTILKGPTIGHFGEETKVGPKNEFILYPGLAFIVSGYDENKQTYKLAIFEGPEGGVEIILSENKGFGKPLEFEYRGRNYKIVARKIDQEPNIIINLEIN